MTKGSRAQPKRTVATEAHAFAPSLEDRFGQDAVDLRHYRNTRLYRSLARVLREYNRRLVVELRHRGFGDFSPAFPQILSNLDTEGTRVGTLAQRAGVSRQAAGKLVMEIESCGYVERRVDAEDARATLVVFTPRGRRLLANVIELLEGHDAEFAKALGRDEYETVRGGLFAIAEMFDPQGGLGEADRR
jgi:DNA-binding MarR family transcriptional regulator